MSGNHAQHCRLKWSWSLIVLGISVTGGLLSVPPLLTARYLSTSHGEARVLHFPPDCSLGMIEVVDATDIEGQVVREVVGPARGDVIIPADKDALLTIRADTSQSLSLLKTLHPDDLYYLSIAVETLSDDDLKTIEHLTGLRRLAIGGYGSPGACTFTGEGLRYLRNMRELRALSLSSVPLTDETLSHLASLPSLEELTVQLAPSLKGSGLKYLKDCPNLRVISFYEVPIDNDALIPVGQMDQLTGLHLQYTQITEEGLVHLKDLHNLKSLTPPDKITDTGLQQMLHLTSLEELSINCRNVNDASLIHLRDFSALQNLTITFSRLSQERVVSILAIPHLDRLVLYLDRFEDDDTRLMGGLACLKAVYPRSQWITDNGLAALQHMKSMDFLDLKDMPITDTGLSHLSGLTSLKYLDLRGTEITDAGLSHLSGLTSLKRLDLTGTKVTDAGLSHLSRLISLQSLRLCDVEITGTGLSHLKGLSNLTMLSLDNCPVENSSITYLKSLDSLRQLGIPRTYIDEQGLEKLKQALPDCQITWQVPPLRIGQPAPQIQLDEFVRAPANVVATWDALKGTVVVLEFWATWCGPCREAVPHINALVDRFKDQPVQFISISDEAPGVVRDFLQENTLKPWVAVNTDRSTGKACGVTAIPYCVVVDRKGIVRARFHPNELNEKILQDLLNE